jgi:hypothetical protein
VPDNLVVNQNAAGASAGVLVTGSCMLISTGDSVFGNDVFAVIELAKTNTPAKFAPTGKRFVGPGVVIIDAPNSDAQYYLRSRLPKVATNTNINIEIVQ